MSKDYDIIWRIDHPLRVCWINKAGAIQRIETYRAPAETHPSIVVELRNGQRHVIPVAGDPNSWAIYVPVYEPGTIDIPSARQFVRTDRIIDGLPVFEEQDE